jgi:hypothetical protein
MKDLKRPVACGHSKVASLSSSADSNIFLYPSLILLFLRRWEIIKHCRLKNRPLLVQGSTFPQRGWRVSKMVQFYLSSPGKPAILIQM